MIRSAQFDDIYFSPDDGLAETAHVFLRGNNLPENWQNKNLFTIAETGFGTGLNFLSAWKLFEETAPKDATLDFISFEKYPLAAEDIQKALLPWSGYFEGRLEKMVSVYPLRVNGFHRRAVSDRVRLTLIFDDVNDALPRLKVPCGINAWFLDGFAPAKNPQMWSEMLYEHMARLSANDATVASFTAAGAVRRGLTAQGFNVSKVRGYGRKRDMTVAVFTKGQTDVFLSSSVRCVAIVGAGLAGTACYAALKRRNVPVDLYDSYGVASHASGNPLGLYNPRFSQHRMAESDIYAQGYALLASLNKEQQRSGSLHLAMDDDKRKRLQGILANWGWHGDHVRWLSADEASDVAGINIKHEALFLSDSGFISPAALCKQNVENIVPIAGMPDRQSYDAVILANGIAAQADDNLKDLPIHTVRGQISFLEAQTSLNLKANICHGGYLSASQGVNHVAGATFQPWRTDTEVTQDDHEHIIGQLESAVPALRGAFSVKGGRASLRCAAKDRFPVIGKVAGAEGLYVSTAHASHGLITSMVGAEYLADLLMGTVWSIGQDSADSLDPDRFSRRLRKQG